MDIRLSGEFDGIEAAREIVMKIKTKLIFITGYSD
jgi:DNA-binding LytR/AlgR family response regulator